MQIKIDDLAAGLYALVDALETELKRLDPGNKLLDTGQSTTIFQAGVDNYVERGRRHIGDAVLANCNKDS